MAAPICARVAEGVVRLGTWIVNWYLVEADGRVVVVDGAVAGYLPQLDTGLKELGRSRSDIEAVVLTHAHVDHVGVVELLRSQLRIPVYVHEDDAELARSAKQIGPNDGSLLPYLRHPMAYRLFFELARGGAAKPRPIAEVQTFADGAELPGGLRALHTPGHTRGHTSFLGRDVLLAGDAICTLNPLTGKRGPQPMPRAFNASTDDALRSLERLIGSGASLLLPGHGDPVDEPDRAVADARRRGSS